MTDAAPFSLRAIAVPAYGPSLLFGLGEGAILPVVALSVRQLGGSIALAALVVTLIGIGSLVCNIPASIVATRFGERRAIVGASLFGAVAMALCAFGSSLAAFALGTFMIGMAAAVFGLARQSWLTEAVPFRFRARALSTLGGVMRIGLFIGPFLGAATIPWLGLAGSYGVGAAALAAAAVLAWRMPDLPATPQVLGSPRASTVGATAGADGGESIAAEGAPTIRGGVPIAAGAVATPPTLRAIGRASRRVFATVGIGVVLVAAVRASRQVVVPLWAEQIGLDAATTSLIYGLAGGIDMLVFYPAGKVMDLKGRAWVAVPSMLVMAAALFALPFSAGAGALLAASLALGFGNGIGSGMVMTLGADHSPAQGRALFLGIWRLLADVGSCGGPALLSAVTALASLAAGVWASAGVALIAAVLLGYWIPRMPANPGAAARPVGKNRS